MSKALSCYICGCGQFAAQASSQAALEAGKEFYAETMEALVGGDRPFLKTVQMEAEHTKAKERAIQTYLEKNKYGRKNQCVVEKYQLMLVEVGALETIVGWEFTFSQLVPYSVIKHCMYIHIDPNSPTEEVRREHLDRERWRLFYLCLPIIAKAFYLHKSCKQLIHG